MNHQQDHRESHINLENHNWSANNIACFLTYGLEEHEDSYLNDSECENQDCQSVKDYKAHSTANVPALQVQVLSYVVDSKYPTQEFKQNSKSRDNSNHDRLSLVHITL